MSKREMVVIWGHDTSANHCYVERLNGFRGALDDGGSLADIWPGNAWFNVDPDYYRRGGREFCDNIPNPDSVILGSAALVQVLQEAATGDVEFLPVKIRDHRKKKIVRSDYHIVHVTTVLDAFDQNRSKGIGWNTLNLDQVSSIDRLVLKKTSKTKSDLFRLATEGLKHLVFARRALSDSLLESGITGLRFWEISEFNMR